MLLALLLAAAEPQTAVDAERAFNAAAQSKGQWTAFREFAADDAVMFVPQVVNAQEWLKDRADPPKSVEWWPTESYVSCDGKVAVNTGGWKRPDGSVGYFTTVWNSQADGRWKWTLDHGDSLATPRRQPKKPVVRRAKCLNFFNHLMTVPDENAVASDSFTSLDGSLMYAWEVRADGSRSLNVQLWNGRDFETVLRDKVAAPQ